MRKRSPGRPGFSLTEVVIALGILSFALISVFSLLPVGLGSIREAEEEAAATGLLEEIAAAITGAQSGQGNFTAAGAWSALTWSRGGAATSHEWENLSLAGTPTTLPSLARMRARVELTPPGDASPAGEALISVAWPASALWDPLTRGWSQHQGELETRLVFLPPSTPPTPSTP